MATLADGDDDRGRPSTREAAALTYRGLTMRAPVTVSPGGYPVLNWRLTLPGCLGAVLVTWIALRALGGLTPLARQRALGAALLLPAALAVAQAWHRPDLPAAYGRSAFADLGTATFIAAAGAALALVAIWRARPREASRPLARR